MLKTQFKTAPVKNNDNSTINNGISKELNFVALFALIFGSMMGSGIFDIPQNITHQAGLIAILLSWSITIFGMLAFSWAFTYITKQRPDIRSGIYGYAKYGFGDYIGFNAAWGYWLNAVLGNASYLIYIFATFGNFAIFKFFNDGTNFDSLIAESVLTWAIYLLISRGIKESSFINILITAIKILTLIAIIVFFIYGFHWQQFKTNLNMHNPTSFGSLATQIKSTMLVTVWDFLGIEAACVYASRAKNINDVAKATMYGVIAVLVIDMLISLLPFGILAATKISTLQTPSTSGVLALIIATIDDNIIRIAILISVIGAMLAWSMLATNIIHLAAVDKTMPKVFAKLSKRNVPSNALLISTLVIQATIIVAYLTDSVYLIMIQLATSLILVPYLLSALFAFKLVCKQGIISWLDFVKGIIAVTYTIWTIYAGGVKYLVCSTILYAVGIAFYVIAKKQHQQVIFTNCNEKIIVIALITVSCCALGLLHYKVLSLS